MQKAAVSNFLNGVPSITLFPDYGEAFPLQSAMAPHPENNDSIDRTTMLSYGLSASLNEALVTWRSEWYENFIGAADYPNERPVWKAGFPTLSWHRKALLLGFCVAQECPGCNVVSRHLFYLISPNNWKSMKSSAGLPKWYMPSVPDNLWSMSELSSTLRSNELI